MILLNISLIIFFIFRKMTTSNVEELMSHFMAMIDAMNGVAPGVAPAPAPTAPAPVPGVISTIQIQYL